MDHIAERIASAVICAVLGIIIVLGLLFWLDYDTPGWALIAIPLGCAVAGLLAGHRAVEVFKEVAGRL